MKSDTKQYEILSNMTVEQRMKAFLELCRSARRIKEAALRQFHPDWSEAEIKAALRESFLHARS
ncbi:MAG: hypothetical protein WCI03_12755 [bacterium]